MTIAQLQRAKEIENRLIILSQQKHSLNFLQERGISSMNLTARGGVAYYLDLTLLDEISFFQHVLSHLSLEIEQLTTEFSNL